VLADRPYICNIHDMQNMSKSFLTADQHRFIDALAALLSGWNMQHNAARVYGYLQICNEPASLDDIARDLEISKSNAWAAARTLEQVADARKISERGTKRISYIAGDDPGAPLRRQTELLGMMAELIGSQKDVVSTGLAAQRMARLAGFHRDLKAAMEAVVMPAVQYEVA
jgi:predicted DNA-binding transcriptional regulator